MVAKTFLELLEAIVEMYNVKYTVLLRAMPELLKGQVLLWYRNNKEFWKNNDNFITDFKNQFLPPCY